MMKLIVNDLYSASNWKRIPEFNIYLKIFCARWKGAFLVQGNWCGGRLYPILQFPALGLM